MNIIKTADQQNVMDNYWMMMKECESQADNEKDKVLMVQVEGWYRLWSRVMRRDLPPIHPIWKTR